MESAILLYLGREHDELRRLNEQKVAQKDMDLSNQHAQIRDLLVKLDDQAAEIAELEDAARAMKEQLYEANERNTSSLTRIAELENRQDFREEMLAFIKDTLAQPAPQLPENP